LSRRVLVIDDDHAVRTVVRKFLEGRGYLVEEAASCRDAEETFLRQRSELAIIDYSLPDGNALELLPRLKLIDPAVPVVILTGHGSIELAVRAIKEGADHFLTKPVELPTLAIILDRLLESRRNSRRQLAGAAYRSRERVEPFLGTSAPIRQLAEQMQRMLATESSMLLQGETGTGKGVLARWAHEHGPRSDEPFVDVNCAGLSREFLETELFGHEKGAFTGAASVKIGLLELADRGTVFLDEIGDVDAHVQPKLLKVLEEKRFRRLGGVQDRLVDIRLIAATHQDLNGLVREQRFRPDLYYRINTLVLAVPPLRERAEDIPMLARHFLTTFSRALGRREMDLSPAAERALQQHAWPGNIRELRNVIERATLLAPGDAVEPRDLALPHAAVQPAPHASSNLTLQALERQHIQQVLGEEDGCIERAAKRLGIHRSSLYNKIRRHGIVL
jgi:DNA-binding NtrC family response regulator